MERTFGNTAALRRQVVTSSPELRALESKLQTCALTRYNRAATAEKEAHKKIRNVLDEQIAEKAASKAKAEAENIIDMMAQVDESKLMEKEKNEYWMKRQASQENTRLGLEKQSQLRKLREEENRLQDIDYLRSAEEYNLKVELQKEMERQRAEIQRLQHHQQELSLIHKLEEQQMEKDVLHDTRLELEILAKRAQERKFAEEKEKRKEGEKLSFIRGLDDQVRFKREEEAREQEKDAEYRKLLLAVMAEEGHTEQLVARARRQRQLDHQQLVDRLLGERRALRAKLVRQRQLQSQEEAAYHQLRRSIVEEEEEQLLLKHAPHLMPFLTPELRGRLRQLL
ncbi:hypothetical protein GWK47_010821 [Chionoecetes opilio]|uniref:Meiosis-specific nuclear structural protein 1 n=1 Tax=Chionoecetes opilio TaxID=41210 RepID=A0A8J4Y378_CHIOP|nr:hypothetical protein GWK47_010821 [Chionoecetes opilio]